ncbi:MAG: hypothetical protein QM758_07505 [Armatimonas sp.]
MSKFRQWLLEGYAPEPEGMFETEEQVEKSHHRHPWWQVMCLTGVDYFSTLGYQPGIAALAAGSLSPIATLVLVLLTLFGALPMYKRVAQASPHGDGSISMLANLLPYWQGKLFVLTLIGFAATGFIITITLSAADAAAHVRENHFVSHFMESAPTAWQIGLTLTLVTLLGAVFLKGFKEAIGIAVGIVLAYIALNIVVIGRGLVELWHHPQHLSEWKTLLLMAHPNPMHMALAAVLVFPQLALGLSGFETGVVVMPLITGDPGDDHEKPRGRIRNAGKLLATAAVMMSVLLVGSSIVTTALIKRGDYLPRMSGETIVTTKELTDGAEVRLHPETGRDHRIDIVLPANSKEGSVRIAAKINEQSEETVPVEVTVTAIDGGARYRISAIKKPGEANGRALAYMAHTYLGTGFGTLYDIVTVLILWFAGASALAGLLNIVPRYLPRYGMAPEWSRANRPLVLIFWGICVLVTLLFQANVDAQAGAYATGVLALMTSATVAVTISAWRAKERGPLIGFGIVTAIFIYTIIVNIKSHPEGLGISLVFILAIMLVSVLSRIWRASELRVSAITLNEEAKRMIQELAKQPEVRLLANHPDELDVAEYAEATFKAQKDHAVAPAERYAFVEVYIQDASNFSSSLRVEGHDVGGFWVLRCYGVAVPNAVAALALHVQKTTGRRPHIYFNWIEGSPLVFLGKFFLTGQGDIAPMTHEILRQAQPDTTKRPIVHAAG